MQGWWSVANGNLRNVLNGACQEHRTGMLALDEGLKGNIEVRNLAGPGTGG